MSRERVVLCRRRRRPHKARKTSGSPLSLTTAERPADRPGTPGKRDEYITHSAYP